MKEQPEPVWLALVLQKESKAITVVGVGTSREEAEAFAHAPEWAGKPMVSVNVLGKPGTFINRLSLWLADNDIVGTENTETVREIAKSLKEKVLEIHKSKE